MRFYVYLIFILLLVTACPKAVHGQTEPERKRIGESSVTLIEPEGIRKIPDSANGMKFLPAFRVVEEPKSFVKIWTPRFTDKKAAKAFAKESGSKFKEMLELEINGQAVPMVITYVDSRFQSGHVYKALFDAENSVLVIATVFDDAPITREQVLDAFKTIKIDVKNPIGDFDVAPFTVDLTPQFEFVFSEFNSLFIKSYPELDASYARPSVSVGYDDIFIYKGEPAIDSLQTASRHLFPIDTKNFFQTDRPDYSKLKISSEGYVELGPGKAFRIEGTYKDRMAIQYVWDIQGNSEFDDYLFLFAMGDKTHLEPMVQDVASMAASLTLKDRAEPARTSKQDAVSTDTEKAAPAIPRVADQPHPLSACEIKRRKLTCEALQGHSGYIFATNLRAGRDTLQYQMSAMARTLRNEKFASIYEEQVRAHMKEAIPLAAKIIGWDMQDPATDTMLEAANAALEKLVISPEEQKRDPESEDLITRLGLQKIEFDGGRFYTNRSSISNQYSLYIDKPGKK